MRFTRRDSEYLTFTALAKKAFSHASVCRGDNFVCLGHEYQVKVDVGLANSSFVECRLAIWAASLVQQHTCRRLPFLFFCVR